MTGALRLCAVLCASLAVGFVGCSDKGTTSSGSVVATASGSAPASAAAPAAKPAAAICDRSKSDERACSELLDDDLATDYASACENGRFAKNESCPRPGVVGVCQLPDGSMRFGYEPSTASQHERSCKDLLGVFAAGSAIPAPLPMVRTRCEGKYEGGCEEEEIYGTARIRNAEEDCKQFGGAFQANASCDRTKALATCNLRGKRTLVLQKPATPDARKSFCEERSGRVQEIAPAPLASGSGAPSAGPAVDDPPEAKGEVTIRRQ